MTFNTTLQSTIYKYATHMLAQNEHMLVQKEAILDSGMMGSFLEIESPCVDKTITKNGIVVRLPTGNTIRSSYMAKLK